MARFTSLKGITPHLFIYMTLVVFGSLILHFLFAKIFKIDADTLIVVSTALVCSPPFVPMVAGAIKNKKGNADRYNCRIGRVCNWKLFGLLYCNRAL